MRLLFPRSFHDFQLCRNSFVRAFTIIRGQLERHFIRKRMARYFRDLKQRLVKHKWLNKCVIIFIRRKKSSCFLTWKLCTRYHSKKMLLLKATFRKLKMNVLLARNVRLRVVRFVYHSIRHRASIEIQKRYRIHSIRRRFIAQKTIKNFVMTHRGIVLILMRKSIETIRLKNENLFIKSVLYRLGKIDLKTDFMDIVILLATLILKETNDVALVNKENIRYTHRRVEVQDFSDEELRKFSMLNMVPLLRAYFWKRVPPRYSCLKCLEVFYLKNLRQAHRITCHSNIFEDPCLLSTIPLKESEKQKENLHHAKSLLKDNLYLGYHVI